MLLAGWLKRRLGEAGLDFVEVIEVTGNSSATHKEGMLEKFRSG